MSHNQTYTIVQHGTRDLVKSVASSEAAELEAPPKRQRIGSVAVTLHEAARMGQLESITRLLDAGEQPDILHEGMTALRIAALAGHVSICRLLLSRGAQVNATRPQDKGTALHCAALMGRIDVCNLLLEWGADINARSITGGTPLCCGAVQGHVELTKFLLAHGADVNLVSYPGSTGSGSALHAAAIGGHFLVSQVLLASGHPPDYARSDGITPLCFAANGSHVQLCALLLSYGARVDSVTKEGMTPLCFAADSGSLDCCLLLIQHNADVNGSDAVNANTPLHCAVSSNSFHICHALLIAGADPMKKVDGETAYDVALRCQHLKIAALINAFLEGQFNFM